MMGRAKRAMATAGASIVLVSLGGLALPALASATSWTIGTPVALSAPGDDPSFRFVSCTGPGTCTAVGTASIPEAEAPADCPANTSDGHGGVVANDCDYVIAAQETNGTWQAGTIISSVPVEDDVSLDGLACTSTATCIVVGEQPPYNAPFYVAESNGSWGGLQGMALPGNVYYVGKSPDAGISGVSCSSASHCVVIGSFTEDTSPNYPTDGMAVVGSVSGFGGLAETGPGDRYEGVSCVSGTPTCTVSGTVLVTDDSDLYAEVAVQSETSGSWGSVNTITSGGGDDSQGAEAGLEGISCPQVNNCTVGGYDPNEDGYLTTYDTNTIQETNGTWGTPMDIDSDGALESGSGVFGGAMSCVSVANCVWGSEGDDTYNSQSDLYYPAATYADAVNGTWSGFQNSPAPSDREPSDDAGSESAAVSCAEGLCTFVGAYSNSTGELPYAFTASEGGLYTVSGKVLGTSCSDTACAVPSGVPGFTVLVQGTSADGSAVQESSVSGTDGSWSVEVPSGSFTAGLSADGSTFASTAMEQSVKVTDADVPNVNFTACAETGVSGSDRDLPAGDPFAGAASEGSFSPSYCESEYTFKLTAKIPQKVVVDASKNAHYNTTSDNGSTGFNHNPSFITAIRDFFRSSVGANKEFPDCLPQGKVEFYTDEKAKVEWYSYIEAGKVIATATVQFIWNQSTHKMELASPPSYSSVSLTRKFVYRVRVRGRTVDGSCADTVKMPILFAVQPTGNNNEGAEIAHEENTNTDSAPFGFELGVWFPFDAYGATIDKNTTLGEKLIDKGAALAKKLFEGTAKLAEAYERLPAYGKFLIETGANLVIGLVAEKVAIAALGEGVQWYREYSTGTRLTAEQLEKLEWLGTIKGMSELLYTLPKEAYSMYAGYFGYPIMSAVIRGRIATTRYLPSAEVSPPREMPYQTTLAVTPSVTKFPTWSLKVSRDALDTCLSGCKVWEGALPWNSSSTTQPETFNQYSKSNPAYVIEDSSKTGHSYTSGAKAVQNMIDDTSQNSELSFGIRHKGSITANFAAAEEQTPAPNCDGDTATPTSDQTICWVFNDWRP